MYNVLEKLRASSAVGPVPPPGVSAPPAIELTAKEKDIHDKGLVSVLKQLHDDLDAAVFDACSWPPTLAEAEILERLVALNAERAREEAAGQIRWLRPDYQIPLFAHPPNPNPNLNPVGTRSTASQTSEPTPELDLKSEPTQKPKKTKSAIRPTAAGQSATPKLTWPSSLPDRTKAILALIQDRGSKPFTAEETARHFKRAQTAHVTEILETLCAVGKARKAKEAGMYIS